MKMTIEEKAKRYDEALEKAKQWYNDPHITIGLKGNLEDIFPELKESAEDTRIEALIEKAFAFIRSCTTYDGLGYKAKCINIEDFVKYMKGE